MIYQYHFDFKDEKTLQTLLRKHIRGVIPVMEDTLLEIEQLFSFRSEWVPLSGQEGRYASSLPFSKDNCDVSWALEIKDVLTLMWSKESETIFYTKGTGYTPERLRFWIYHTFAPMMFVLRGIYDILHVGSVEIEGRPVLFSAPSFGGKSTMTDYFIQQGHVMLSDDAVGIERADEKYWAVASYPYHRPYREAETLGERVKYFSEQTKPVHAVYVLEKSDPYASVEISEIKGIEKFKAFHYSSFIKFDFMKQQHFDFFMQMSRNIPVYKVIIPWDMNRLDEVYQMIVKHSKAM